MKRIILSLLTCASLFFVASCNKEYVSYDERKMCNLSVNLMNYDITTKAEDSATDVLFSLYDQSGNIVDWKRTGNSSNNKQVSFTVPAGNYVLYATVGQSSVDNSSELTLKNLNARLEDDADGTFTMVGKQSISLSSNTTIKFDVHRAAAKIVLGTVHLDWAIASKRGKALTMNSAYIIDVAKTITFDNVFNKVNSPIEFYNKNAYSSSSSTAVKNLVYSAVNSSLPDDNQVVLNRTFYVYPNTNGSLKTKFILDCSFGGETMYYPVAFDSILPNNIYTINDIYITKSGVKNPEDPWVNDVDFSANITVVPWNTTPSINVNR